MKTILCPTDFSKDAGNTAEYASALAHEFKSRLILVHAYETPFAFTEAPMTIIKDAENEIRLAADKKLTALQKKIEKDNKGIVVERLLLNGAPAEMITNLAHERSADLIIMGATGMNKLERLLMGSTTSKVIHLAKCPVLCIPRGAKYEGVRKIVFSTDLNEDNINSALSIVTFARHFDAEISFLFVDDKHLIHSDESIAEMTKKIRSRVHYTKLSGYIAKNPSITKGIEYFLKKNKAQVLVMLTHERHFPESLFTQSVTKIMSHQTKIPLLAIKPATKSILQAS